MTSDTRVNGPLAGISAVDLTRDLAAAHCSMLLADAGASVTAVALAGQPEGWEAAWAHASPASLRAMRAAVGRGKRSLELDPERPADREVLARLAADADVLLDGWAAPALAAAGVSVEELRREHPRLVVASITLWGGDGPDHPAASVVAEAEATLLWRPRSDGSPVGFGFPVGEMAAGLAAYGAIVTALLESRRTGRGRHLPLSMVRSLLAMNSINVTGAQIPSQPGMGTAGYGVFRSRDGFIILGVNTDKLWARLCAAMERPDLAVDPRFREYRERDLRVEEANAIITDWTTRHTSDELVERIGPGGVPVGRILDPAGALASAQLHRLGYFVRVDDGGGASLEVPANPLGYGPPE